MMTGAPRWWSRRGRALVVATLTGAALVAGPSLPSATGAPGDLTPYPVPGAPHGVAVAPDGRVWFTLRTAGIVGVLDPADGSVTEVPLPDPSSEPSAIAIGTDGSIWFTLQAGNAIGRLIPEGDLVVYPLPHDGSAPAGIAAAPDGSVWFTERFGHRIGRIALDGTISEWAVPNAGPAGIALGPGGVIWFTAQATSRLGALDPSDGSVGYSTLPAASQPTGVTLDDAGDVWVTLRRASAAARLEVGSGDVTIVPLTADGTPTGIAAGADGGIWIAETSTSTLVRVDPVTGGTATVGLGGPTAPQQLASDPAGSLWVAEAGAGRLSSLEIEVLPTDGTAPAIEIRSPADGSWTAPGVPLVAAYGCTDEGGSGLSSCAGPAANGGEVVPPGPGAHPFEVVATDGAGNTSAASVRYLAFSSVDGWTTGGTARAGEGLSLSLGMGLETRAEPGAILAATRVDCGSGEPLGPPEPAELRSRVAHGGSLEIRWLTSKGWAGECRTATIAFAADGWSGASATFGVVAFEGPGGRQRP